MRGTAGFRNGEPSRHRGAPRGHPPAWGCTNRHVRAEIVLDDRIFDLIVILEYSFRPEGLTSFRGALMVCFAALE